MEKEIDLKIRALEKMQDRNWQRIVFNLRKHLDCWSYSNINPAWQQMKLSYWPVICNIGIDGSTPSDLSKKSMINKQNISRTVKELEDHGMVEIRTNEADKRSDLIFLTENGKKLIFEANSEVIKMNEIYQQVIGKKELEITLTALNKILAYHEHLLEK
ncbi:hypothetical protein ASU31_00610 [Pedobacter ginsenosidimutans]|uniref:HTH marR-type domain-containing protein n=1 Tax=Pedobacter ginsenosidimutans TaxID=687842 RepID=A0A0T5VVI2_9SPHI|nr:MarR family winged helix-turn-helix transcriptional regulator [Pedobacter ginsenosidimutans]KRT17832.1 hypothetical protein ASU31_00610 [Pedobacter ginsenosidimutans]